MAILRLFTSETRSMWVNSILFIELSWTKPHLVQWRNLDILHLESKKWDPGVSMLSWVQPGML